ncbi:helix-turn-helix domain-containing protein [Actinokineospora bangkokensis]|uniref:Transcriptional regulator n=1 Tax=Actinokineospora bangkokensis TaxID=1193682 RepID=A0A1Q9LS47_9PSEU|nr:XRE family transcriptional regulator [Actinokineospora bangkokensis]OLR94866.1 transcriptional regulator [Actinokineospora bangkokensis]
MAERGAPREVIARSLRRERERSGLSLGELGRRAGVAKSTLSQLEAGTGNPSIETLWAVSSALGVPFSRLVDPPAPVVRVVRLGEAEAVPSDSADYTTALLSAGPPGARRDLYLVSAEPGSRRESAPHPPGEVEHVVLCTGRALVGPVDEPVELRPGDFITYPGDAPHVFEALDPATTAVMLSEYR